MQEEIRESYSLKKNSLKRWIFQHGLTQTEMAKKLGIDVVEFKKKLYKREPFSWEQLMALINFVGIRAAYNIIYFPVAQTDSVEVAK